MRVPLECFFTMHPRCLRISKYGIGMAYRLGTYRDLFSTRTSLSIRHAFKFGATSNHFEDRVTDLSTLSFGA